MENKQNNIPNLPEDFLRKSKQSPSEWPEEWDEFDVEAAEGLSKLNNKERLQKIHHRIDIELQEKKKNNSFYYFITAAASIMLVLGFYFLFDFSAHKEMAMNDHKSFEMKPATDTQNIVAPLKNEVPTNKDEGTQPQKNYLESSTRNIAAGAATEEPGIHPKYTEGKEGKSGNIKMDNKDVSGEDKGTGDKTSNTFETTSSFALADDALKRQDKDKQQTLATLPPAPTQVAERAEDKVAFEESISEIKKEKSNRKKTAEKDLSLDEVTMNAAPASASGKTTIATENENDNQNKPSDLIQFILKNEPELKGKTLEITLFYGNDLLLKEVSFTKWPKGYNDLKNRVRKFLEQEKTYFNGSGKNLGSKNEIRIRFTINDND
jgi:hypothetical protein